MIGVVLHQNVILHGITLAESNTISNLKVNANIIVPQSIENNQQSEIIPKLPENTDI